MNHDGFMEGPAIPQGSLRQGRAKHAGRFSWKAMFRVSGLLFVCAAVIMCLCFVYLSYLSKMTTDESLVYMMELSGQIAGNVQNSLNTNLTALETIASVMETGKISSLSELQELLKKEEERWGFSDIAAVDQDGRWHHCDGSIEYVPPDQYLVQAFVDQIPAVTPTRVLDGRDCILFAVPFEDAVIEGTRFLSLVTAADLDEMNKLLALGAYNGEGYAQLIEPDGSIVVRSNHKNAVDSGFNLLVTLQGADFQAGASYSQMYQAIQNGDSGLIQYSYDGIRKYLYYAPVNVRDWYLLTVIPTSAVNRNTELLFHTTAGICAGICVFFILFLMLFLLSQYRNKKRLEVLAYVDPVTGGNSKGWFEQEAERRILDRKRPYALIYSNIDRFKLLNERFGRETADGLLKSIYELITGHLKDTELACRLVADNFGILMEYTDLESAERRLERLNCLIARLTGPGKVSYNIEMTYGLYLPDQSDDSIIIMLDRANLARKQLDPSSGLVVGVYDDDARQRLVRDNVLEGKMHDALANHDFHVYLQPKYELKNETIDGAEALVRWKDPEEGMIFPDSFIPLFERNGFIVDLDFYVFQETCRALRRWLDSGKKPVTVSVNLSRANLANPDFLGKYREILYRLQIPPEYVEFEFTESLVYENVELLCSLINEIHRMGCTCSMDDFGSGYSSLNMLKDVEVDVLKLDKGFFNLNEGKSSRGKSIVKGIISLARNLDLTTVSEGIETWDEVAFLREIGCDMIQGYVFARPMPIPEFERLLYGESIPECQPAENRNG